MHYVYTLGFTQICFISNLWECISFLYAQMSCVLQSFIVTTSYSGKSK